MIRAGGLSVTIALLVIAACSEDASTSSASSADGGTDAGRREAAVVDAQTTTCAEDCATAHPEALAADRAINACWTDRCSAACIDGRGDAGADAGACTSPVATGTPACDDCTIVQCCAPWDACFGDAECAALEACLRTCPSP